MGKSETVSKYRVVCADAEPVTRLGVGAAMGKFRELELCGEAVCARTARELCEKLQPDVLVLDLALAEGLVLIKDLPRWSPGTRVVVFTGLSDTISVQRALQAGALGYVTRRDPVSALMQSVLAAAVGKRWIGPDVETAFWDSVAAGDMELRGEGVQALTNRELQVFQLLGRGLALKTVAEELRLSVKTVESHCSRIKDKLGLRSGQELQRRAASFAESRAV